MLINRSGVAGAFSDSDSDSSQYTDSNNCTSCNFVHVCDNNYSYFTILNFSQTIPSFGKHSVLLYVCGLRYLPEVQVNIRRTSLYQKNMCVPKERSLYRQYKSI